MDLWADTVSGRLFRATSINPLTWSFTEGETVGVVVEGLPADGSLIVGTEDGHWRIVSPSELTGLNASAITEGVIDPARLPWRAPVFYTLSADVTKSTTSPTWGNITGLSFPVEANTNYDIVCQIAAVSAATTTGFGIGWTGPASPTLTSGQFVSPTGGQAIGGTTTEGNDTGNATTGVGVATPQIAAGVFMGMWRNGSTAGTVQMRFRTEVDTSAVTIKAGSYCKVTAF
jgi:hypothetical protein